MTWEGSLGRGWQAPFGRHQTGKAEGQALHNWAISFRK